MAVKGLNKKIFWTFWVKYLKNDLCKNYKNISVHTVMIHQSKELEILVFVYISGFINILLKTFSACWHFVNLGTVSEKT